MARPKARAVEDAGKVDVDYPPASQRVDLERRRVLHDAGVVDGEDVERRRRGIARAELPLTASASVTSRARASAPIAAAVASARAGSRVGDGDAGAALGEDLGDRPADAAGAAGDDGAA